MFDDLLSLPHREFFGRAALRLPADGDLPELPVSVYRASRWHDEPGELWDGRLAPRENTFKIKFGLAGRAWTRLGRDDFVHEPGTVVLVLPGERTWSRVPDGSEPWDLAYVSLQGREAVRLGKALFARTGRTLAAASLPETSRRFAELLRRMAAGGYESVWAESRAAYGLLVALWDEATSPGVSAARRRLDAALRFEEANLDRPVSVAELAAAAGLSESHLHRLFLQETGTTPHKHLVATRLERARELLRTSPLSVKEVCARSGFRDLPNFCRLYKRAFGVTPGATRGGPAGRGGVAFAPGSR